MVALAQYFNQNKGQLAFRNKDCCIQAYSLDLAHTHTLHG